MNQDDRARVIRGQVMYQGQWVLIEEKEQRERDFRTRLENGFVYHEGKWMKIDEKIACLTAAQNPSPPPLPSVQNATQEITKTAALNIIDKEQNTVQSLTETRSYTMFAHDSRTIKIVPESPAPARQQGPDFQQFLSANFPQEETPQPPPNRQAFETPDIFLGDSDQKYP